MNLCGGCHKSVPAIDSISCNQCSHVYHSICVNMSKENLKKLSRESRSTWKCPTCKANARKGGDNSETPVRATKSEVADKLDFPSQSPLSLDCNLKDFIHTEIKAAINLVLPSILRESLTKELKPLRDELNSLTEAMDFANKKYEEMKLIIEKRDTDVKDLLDRNLKLENTVKDMYSRISNLEQHSRDQNLEIHGLPEFKNEDLAKTVVQIGKVVQLSLDDCDILSCFRVAKMNPSNSYPRTTVIKMRSNRCRDNVLAAVATYNKEHPKDKLNTHIIGIGGEQVPVYISEHLSPERKALHAATRQKAKALGYKFVWVRNGRIYIRKDETSKAKQISALESLSLLE